MLTTFIQNGAEKRFIKMLQERRNLGKNLGSVLLCAFSTENFRTTPESVLPLLDNILGSLGGELYFCDDGDLLVYWRGGNHLTQESIMSVLHRLLTKELSSINNEKIFKFYDLKIRSPEIKMILLEKIQRPKIEQRKTSVDAPSSPTVITPLELSDLQQESFDAALMRRNTKENPEIMVVEDQHFSRILLLGLFNKEYRCFGAKDAKEAISNFSVYAPDIIFLDIELPDQNGHELAKFFKSLDPLVHIVMVTANHYQKDVKKAIENQVNGFVVKPYNKQKLLNAIESHKKFKLKKG